MGWDGIIRMVVVNHHPPVIGMAIDALISSPSSILKALVFEGFNKTVDGDIAKKCNRRVLSLGHTLTVTTGSETTWVVVSLGTVSPASCISQT